MSYSKQYDALLNRMQLHGPDLANGNSNHAPMTVEALYALGHDSFTLEWFRNYEPLTVAWPACVGAIPATEWRQFLGCDDHVSDWRAFFQAELRRDGAGSVLAKWVPRLIPGLSGSAAHGVIRTGHAVRALRNRETPQRLHELGDALAYWAATYTEISAVKGDARGLMPAAALALVPQVPLSQRRPQGSITGALAKLDIFAPFAPVIDWVLPDTDPMALAQLAARVLLTNVDDVLTAIVFVHGVTAIHALTNLASALTPDVARAALPYAWQLNAALYTVYGTKPPHMDSEAENTATPAALIDAAIAHGDEHAIKITEACVSFNRLSGDPIFLDAAAKAIEFLPRA